MNTKEAIERVKARFDKWALDNEDLIALQVLGLVDAESEDERMRRELIGHLKECRNNTRSEVMLGAYAKWIAYLERQKDVSKAIEAVEKIDKYIKYTRAHTANARDMDDSNPNKGYYSGVDDTLSNIAGILNGVYSEGKQKEQKPVEWDGADAATIEIACDVLRYCFGPDEKLPCTFEGDWDVTRDTLIDRLNSLHPQIKQEWSKEDEQNLNVCLSYIKDETLRQWLKNAIHIECNKPIEWSEEDREMRMKVLKYLSTRCNVFEYEEVENWFKSISERFNFSSN